MRNDFESNYLAHHGILGMKWGHKNGPPYPLDASDHSSSEKKAGYKKSLGGGRNESLYSRASKKQKVIKKRDAISLKAAGHKAMAKIYEINENTYAKSNKTLASMNKAAKNEQLAKAKKAQEASNAKKAEKNSIDKRLKEVDPELAKNKVTKRVALDYHNMSELQFRGKYKTTKKTFAKRYARSKGDTYSVGKRKAAIALAFIGSQPASSIYIGNGKYLQVTGKKAAAKCMAYDLGSVVIGTNLGYKKAEMKYKNSKQKG